MNGKEVQHAVKNEKLPKRKIKTLVKKQKNGYHVAETNDTVKQRTVIDVK